MSEQRTPQVGEVWTYINGPSSVKLLAKDDAHWFVRWNTGAYDVMEEHVLLGYYRPPVLFPSIPDEFWLRAVNRPGEGWVDAAVRCREPLDDDPADRHDGWIKVRVVERRPR